MNVILAANRWFPSIKSSFNLVTILVFLSAGMVAQESGPAPQKRHLTPIEVRRLLRSPGGLQAAANAEGEFVLHSRREVWTFYDLPTLVSSSSVIVLGTLQSADSHLSDNGNDISTEYMLHSLRSLKGNEQSDLTFKVEGGKVQFSNGTSAEVKTPEWEHLKIGSTYVLFLNKDREELSPTGQVQGIFEMPNGPMAKIVPLASFDERPFTVKEAKEHSSESFIAEIQKLASR